MNSGYGLDKVLVTYCQVESNQFELPHVDSNCLWLLKPFYFIVIIIQITFFINESVHSSNPFALFHSSIAE